MTSKRQPDTTLPANIAAEKALLGAVLLDNSLFEATKGLDADDFSLDSHRLVYLHIAEMIDRGEGVDLVTLAEDMKGSGDLACISDTPVAYLAGLSEDTIRYRPSVRDWVRIVKKKSLLRRLIGACETAARRAYAGERGSDILSSLKENLDEIEAEAKKGLRQV